MFDQAHFRDTILQTFGEQGRQWLDDLPGLVDGCCQRWSVHLDTPFLLSYNFVAPGIRDDGSRVVLKVGVPNPELLSEMAALRIYDGRGAARLLESDVTRGAMLLERVLPGRMLSELQDDEEATRIIARTMRRLWRPLSLEQACLFPDISRWVKALFQLETEPVIRELRFEPRRKDGSFLSMVDRDKGMAKDLLASQGERVLLHGDLHHDNILSAGGESWLAIDPKGVAGAREFEVGPLTYNPWQRVTVWPDLQSILGRRLDILVAELGFDRQRLLAWSFVETVLSMTWSIDDNDPQWDHIMPVADALLSLQ